jgi:hypothetical protein
VEIYRSSLRGLFLVLCLSTLMACTMTSPRKQNREDRLRDDLRAFHWALIGQEISLALRFVPSGERDAWDETLVCAFKRVRLLDYLVELIDFRDENKEATVRVRWTGHRLNSLATEETLWKEEWSFDPLKQRWSLLSAPGDLKGLSEACLFGRANGESSADPGR